VEITLNEPHLVQQAQQWAQETGQPVEQVVETAIQSYFDELEKAAIHAETQAFWSRYEELLQAYAGQHIAMYGGDVIDHDADVAQLQKRVRAQYGSRFVLIAPVPQRRELRWRGGRLDMWKQSNE